MIPEDYSQKDWWSYIGKDLQDLLMESSMLLTKVASWDEKFSDYSFVVFPAAKAYEGYLKKMFLDHGLITQEDYYGKRFRIGKALNPSLDPRYEDENVYKKIAEGKGGKELADKLWETWKLARNTIFHWFPDEKNVVSLNEAGEKVARIIDTIDACSKQCKINNGN